MTWEDIKRKLTSRKFWAAIVEFVSMLLMAQGMTENIRSALRLCVRLINYLYSEILRIDDALAPAFRAKKRKCFQLRFGQKL